MPRTSCPECAVIRAATGNIKSRVRCKACKKKESDNMMVLYKARKSQGLCVKCGKISAIPDKVMCGICAKTLNERGRAKRQKRLGEGLCGRCGKPAISGSAQCESCKQQDRDSYHHDKARGVCTRCGKMLSGFESIVCTPCRERHKDISIEYLRKLKADPLRAQQLREYNNAWQKKQYHDNPAYRQARKDYQRHHRQHMNDITHRDIAAYWHIPPDICQGCGRQITQDMAIDHLYPKSLEPNNENLWNYTLLCRPCNSRKHDKLSLSGLRLLNQKLGILPDMPTQIITRLFGQSPRHTNNTMQEFMMWLSLDMEYTEFTPPPPFPRPEHATPERTVNDKAHANIKCTLDLFGFE